MFPLSIFCANADGTLTMSQDPYSSMRSIIHFPNGDFTFSMLPFQSSLIGAPDVTQSVSYSDSDRSNGGVQTVTIRIIMSGKEVGSIIGKKGDNVKRFREQSGARINISDGSSPERIVSVSGTVDKVSSAFLLICEKFEDDYVGVDTDKTDRYICPPVTLRLLVPATQCGSIIGKGGCKIKEIRDMCGASIQVASELLPGSSERSVTVSGTAASVTKCIKQISLILLETPVRFGTIPYKPKPPFHTQSQPLPHIHSIPPLTTFNSGQPELLKPIANMSSNNIQTPIALFPMPSNVVPAFLTDNLQFGNYPSPIPMWLKPQQQQHYHHHHQQQQQQQQQQQHSLSYPNTPEIQSPVIFPHQGCSQQLIEMVISNDLIGCVIGRAGTTINEIRSMSGAQIKISDGDDSSTERRIIISGSVDSINTAQLLINSNIQSYHSSLNSQTVKTVVNTIDSSIPSRVPPSTHHCLQRTSNKLSSLHFTPDGNPRSDHVYYNPY